MNNKGFSLIELLAIITILGLIMGMAIPAYQQYVTKTRNEAYRNLVITSRTAAQDRFMDEGLEFSGSNCKRYNIVSDLYGVGYMDKPTDPANNAANCDGTVYIKNVTGDDDTMENYMIKVELDCVTPHYIDCKDSGGTDCSATFGTCN